MMIKKIKLEVKRTFVYYLYRLLAHRLSYVFKSLEWLSIRLFMSVPSKHVRRLYLNSYKNVSISKRVPIYSGFIYWKGKLEIGTGSSIGFNNHFDCRKGIVIGKNVDTATGVMIWSLHHDYNDVNFKAVGGQVTIGDYVWLGARCLILPGVTIGEGAVVGAGAVVCKDVEPWTVVGGVPAKKIGTRKAQKYLYHPSDYWIPFF